MRPDGAFRGQFPFPTNAKDKASTASGTSKIVFLLFLTGAAAAAAVGVESPTSW
jgi:hypothetical protein